MERRNGLVNRVDAIAGSISQSPRMRRLLFIAGLSRASCNYNSAEESAPDLSTNVYVVPPGFPNTEVVRRPSALEILETAGIAFPEQGSAIYNPATSHLIVRNAQEQMEVVEAFIDTLVQRVEKQIDLTLREIEDWNGILGTPREPSRGRHGPAPPCLLRERSFLRCSEPSTAGSSGRKNKVRRGIAGVFTAPQFQVVIRALGEKLGEKAILSPPSVMALSGQSVLDQGDDKRWGIVPVIGADEQARRGSKLMAEGNPEPAIEPSLGYSTRKLSLRDRG